MITQTQIQSAYDAFVAAVRADDEDAEMDATIALGAILGQGTPADEAFADNLGPDYVCALDDGTIVAWGHDIGIRGRVIRDLKLIAPEAQR